MNENAHGLWGHKSEYIPKIESMSMLVGDQQLSQQGQ